MKLSSHIVPLGAVALIVLTTLSAQAQTVYKYVGPDGRIVFSDKPPENVEGAVQRDREGRYGEASASESELPYALRQVVGRYPVTLYTSENCQPCDSGRSLLKTRGIPYTEKTIRTQQDSAMLVQMANTDSLPVLSIGSQLIKGFLASEWSQYLDAAGYPETSQLPRNYNQPQPQPLTEPVQPPTRPATAAAGNGENGTPTATTEPTQELPTIAPSSPNAPPGFTF